MEKLIITKFNRNQLRLSRKITCLVNEKFTYSVEQVIKLGLLGYLDNLSELHLRQYLVLREIKFLGGLTDYELEGYRLYYKCQAKEVNLKVPEGVTGLDRCFEESGIEVLRLCGEKIVRLHGLVKECKLLREVLIDTNFSDGVIDLSSCFRDTLSLQRVIFSKVVNRAKIFSMFMSSGIKEIRLRDYVLNVEDDAWNCFCGCKKLESLDCSGVKFNKDVYKLVGDNPKLETISFRDCWFGGEVDLTWESFSRPVTIDLRGARGKGLEKVKSLSKERGGDKAVDTFIRQFELEKVTLILD